VCCFVVVFLLNKNPKKYIRGWGNSCETFRVLFKVKDARIDIDCLHSCVYFLEDKKKFCVLVSRAFEFSFFLLLSTNKQIVAALRVGVKISSLCYRKVFPIHKTFPCMLSTIHGIFCCGRIGLCLCWLRTLLLLLHTNTHDAIMMSAVDFLDWCCLARSREN
jgi:hypothetical protein